MCLIDRKLLLWGVICVIALNLFAYGLIVHTSMTLVFGLLNDLSK